MSNQADKRIETAQNRAAEIGMSAEGLTANAPTQEGPNGTVPVIDYLGRTRLSSSHSKSYMETDLARQWERGYRMFNSQHPPGSKYFSEDYKHRSKIFRPKTRTAIRKNEARCAMAFFSNSDVVTITPDDGADPRQKASAAFYMEMMNIRLQRTIPWFLICTGSFQTCEITGCCFAKVYWSYRVREWEVTKTLKDPLTGITFPDQKFTEREIVEDKPVIQPIPPENVRIHRAASWLNPINDSPFVQILTPMFAGDVKELSRTVDSKTGRPQFKDVTDGQLRSASKYSYDATRQAREGARKQDPMDSSAPIADHEIVWVIENWDRIDGEDMHWLTLAEDAVLTDPVPLKTVYPHGRPLVMGRTNNEAFKVYAAGKTELGGGLQQAQNDLQNLRFDNVAYAMQGRPIVRRGRNIDLQQVGRHISGSPILVTSLDDIQFDRPQDVTRSSYEEQNFLNADHDEIMGSFSSGSVNTNRRLNETVGGMEMMSQSSDQIGDYDLRTFGETFVEPVMTMLLKMEQTYETDEALMLKAGDAANLVQRHRINQLDDSVLNAELTLSINVGIGQTDPMKRLQRFLFATKASIEMVTTLMGPSASTVVNIEENINEIYSLAGYRNAKRFYNFGDENPAVQMLMQELQGLQGALEAEKKGNETKMAVAQAQSETAVQVQSMKNQGSMAELLMTIRQARDEAILENATRRYEARMQPKPAPKAAAA